MGLLDLTGPQTVLWAASKILVARGWPGYDEVARELVVYLKRPGGNSETCTHTAPVPLQPLSP